MEADNQRSDSFAIRRLVPDKPFPPYSYVNGKFPPPIRDPAGHSFGIAPMPCPPPDPAHWPTCRPYLYGLDLFNHGYYWEAHEVWEQIWHAADRTGPVGSFIKGLIKLAAAGVKVREGRPAGVRSHARRAAELFSITAEQIRPEQQIYFGLLLPRLIEVATGVVRDPPSSRAPVGAPVEIVFSFALWPIEPLRSEPAG